MNSLHKGQWRGALTFSLICAWINSWVNNREAGDLRRHHAHYDVTVLYLSVHSHDVCIRVSDMPATSTCRPAISHYLRQCWPRSMSPYGVTRPQLVNIILHSVGDMQQTLQWRHNGRDAVSNPASPFFTHSFIQAQIKENIKAPRHWSLCGEFTGDRWIPRTNGQQRGKCFHLMTSSWEVESSVTRGFLCNWRVHPLTPIKPYAARGQVFMTATDARVIAERCQKNVRKRSISSLLNSTHRGNIWPFICP